MQRIAKILAAIVFAFACTDAAAHGGGSWGGGRGGYSGGGGSWGGGRGGYSGGGGSWVGGRGGYSGGGGSWSYGGGGRGWRRGGWGPYLGWGYYPYGNGDYDWPYDYDYGYGAVSRYCVTTTRSCVLHQPRYIGAGCSCKGASGRVSGG